MLNLNAKKDGHCLLKTAQQYNVRMLRCAGCDAGASTVIDVSDKLTSTRTQVLILAPDLHPRPSPQRCRPPLQHGARSSRRPHKR